MRAARLDGITQAYAMEYCPKGDLGTWLRVPRSKKEIVSAFLEVCNGVEAIHKLLIHRDIKPSNILRGEDGRFKISDFGLSVSLDPNDARVTSSNWVSHGFSAPEQFARMATVGKTADVFSVGAVLYYMLTGKDCSTPPMFRDPGLPREMQMFLPWLLFENPSDRLQSISDVRKLFGKLGNLHPIEHLTNDRCPLCNGPQVNGVSSDYDVYITCLLCDNTRYDADN